MPTITTTHDDSAAARTSMTKTQNRTQISAAGVLRSEWVKFRSLRSNITILAAAAGVMILVGIVFSGFVGGVFSNPDEASEFANNPAGASLRGTLLATLIIGVLGVMAITNEYATGTIRTSLTMIPTRLPVLWAKLTVTAAVTFAAMLISTLIAFYMGQALIASGGVATAALGDPGVLRAVIGTAGYLTGVALIGLTVGVLLRSTAAAISTLIGVFLILPGLAGILLPASWRDNVLQFLPSNAGDAFMQVEPTPGFLSPTSGSLVFLAWSVVCLTAAAIILKRRPA